MAKTSFKKRRDILTRGMSVPRQFFHFLFLFTNIQNKRFQEAKESKKEKIKTKIKTYKKITKKSK